MKGAMPPLSLDSAGLEGARAALTEPERRRVGVRVAFVCALLMALSAAALCAVILLGGWTPSAGEGPPAGVRGGLAR